MRLIDADALMDKKKWLAECSEDARVFRFAVHCSDIKDAPTIDAQPVVHGRWEWLGPYCGNNEGDIGTCSVCKKRMRLFEKNYCPNCGAKMLEADHEDHI